MASFFNVANSALSTAFWSSARLPSTCFFCPVVSTCPAAYNARDTNLRLLSLLEEGLLARLLLALFPGKVVVRRNLVHHFGIQALEVYACACRNDISGVHSSEGDTVDFEWAGDEQDALRECFEEDDTLASEAAGEKDENRSGL